MFGAGTFLILAYGVSTNFALRYAIVIIALVQLLSIFVAKKIISRGNQLDPEIEQGHEASEQAIEKTAENII